MDTWNAHGNQINDKYETLAQQLQQAAAATSDPILKADLTNDANEVQRIGDGIAERLGPVPNNFASDWAKWWGYCDAHGGFPSPAPSSS